MNKKLSFLLVILLFISTWINFYFFNSWNKDKIEFSNDISTEKTINKNEKNNVLKKISINEFINNDNLILPEVYDKMDSNLFKLMNNEFVKVNNVKSFIKFDNKYGWIYYLVWVIKWKDKKKWDKYWWFSYEKHIFEKDVYFLGDIKKNWIKDKKGFIKLLEKEFNRINIWISHLNKEELWMDINVYFNSLSLNSALKNCTYLRDTFYEKYRNDKYSCEDKIYFYRATKDNHFCNKIVDKFKSRVCKDFLLYQDSL